MSADESTLNERIMGQILFFIFNNMPIKSLNKNDAQCGCHSSTVELSQAINDFQQQQTGRLLSVHSAHGCAV